MALKGSKSARIDGKTIDHAKRRRDALMMRATRATYQQVADKHYKGNKGFAHRDMQRAINELPKEAAENVRQHEMELLDVMARGLMARAIRGDDKAVNSMLNIMARRTKYLGLDTPVQFEAAGMAGAFPISVNPDLLPPKALEALAEDQAARDAADKK